MSLRCRKRALFALYHEPSASSSTSLFSPSLALVVLLLSWLGTQQSTTEPSSISFQSYTIRLPKRPYYIRITAGLSLPAPQTPRDSRSAFIFPLFLGAM
jgi:hypothetical protein